MRIKAYKARLAKLRLWGYGLVVSKDSWCSEFPVWIQKNGASITFLESQRVTPTLLE
jgi:hypothetical protein